MKYDIFISYKRKGTSSATAAYLYELLQQKGYNVFFDRKEMRSGKFNEQILEHITNATDIIILLEEGSLGSWFDYRTVKKSRALGDKDSSGRLDPGIGFQEEPYKADWFCKEVMHALSLPGKHIIPILLDGYKMPERKDLPPEMADLSDYQALNLDVSETEEFYEKYLIGKDYLHSKPANLSLTKRFQSKGGIVACFLLYTDADSCDLYECGEKIATLTDNDDEWHPFRYPVNFAGEHRFRAINNDSCEIVTIRCSVETNCQQYVQIQFTDTRDLWQLTKEEIAAQDDAERLYNWGCGLFNGTIKHEPDVDLSFECFQRAIDLGSQDALAFVVSYGSGLVTQKHASDEVAIKWYTIAAEQNNPEAYCSLGWFYYDGEGVDQDYETAFEWFLKGAERGDANGQNNIGCMYMCGLGVEKDYGKAFEWFLKSAEQGNAAGQFYLGYLLENGWGVEQDYRKAFEWYQKCADQGDADGQRKLGYFYEDGLGVEQDYEKAVEWYRKSAEQGDEKGQFLLGALYEEGHGVEQDYGKAFEWYEKSAEQGESEGQRKLGYFYDEGLGVEQNYGKAFEWYEKSAEQDNAIGQCFLGKMYEEGNGVEQDYGKAFEWYHKSAEQGFAYSQFKLGCYYEDGLAVEQDYGKAFEWYEKSADQGDADGQRKLGYFYEDGLGVEQDYVKAFEWYEKSAEQGNDLGQAYLGTMYEDGHGVEQDYGKAFEWYHKAAEQGCVFGQLCLGGMYLKGRGVKQDFETAIEWYQRAAEQGNESSYNPIAWTYHLMGRDAEALPWAEKAVEADPEDRDSIDTLATVYEELGRYEEALEQFEDCYRLYRENGDDEGAKETRTKINALKQIMARAGNRR
ncbi:MAG: SEL1-like repeat protein [Bacteroidales bacterium]|nr:SEL1-like repeat protein [Bacteroidales bacterium]